MSGIYRPTKVGHDGSIPDKAGKIKVGPRFSRSVRGTPIRTTDMPPSVTSVALCLVRPLNDCLGPGRLLLLDVIFFFISVWNSWNSLLFLPLGFFVFLVLLGCFSWSTFEYPTQLLSVALTREPGRWESEPPPPFLGSTLTPGSPTRSG